MWNYNVKKYILIILGFFLIIIGLKNPMILIFPMWIFTYLLKDKLSTFLEKVPVSVSFIVSGVFFGLLTESFAIINNISIPVNQRVLLSSDPLTDLIFGFFYYLILIFSWYLLLSKIRYSKLDVFIITGLYGIFTEESGKVFLRIFSIPISGFLYALIIMFVYGIFPMLAYMITEDRFKNKEVILIKRYLIAGIVLFLQWGIYGLFILPFLKNI